MRCRLAVMLVLWLGPALAAEMPDPVLTPGAWRDLSLAEICNTKWGKDHRAVTASMKREVFSRYGYTGNDDPRCNNPHSKIQRCEIDHRDPRELGGDDVLANLGVQPYAGKCNAHDKDRLENKMHRMVCATPQQLSLPLARRAFEGDWREAFKQYVDPDGCE